MSEDKQQKRKLESDENELYLKFQECMKKGKRTHNVMKFVPIEQSQYPQLAEQFMSEFPNQEQNLFEISFDCLAGSSMIDTVLRLANTNFALAVCDRGLRGNFLSKFQVTDLIYGVPKNEEIFKIVSIFVYIPGHHWPECIFFTQSALRQLFKGIAGNVTFANCIKLVHNTNVKISDFSKETNIPDLMKTFGIDKSFESKVTNFVTMSYLRNHYIEDDPLNYRFVILNFTSESVCETFHKNDFIIDVGGKYLGILDITVIFSTIVQS